MKSPDDRDYVLGVVGAGAMGRGIAQVAAQGGLRTLIFDAADGAAEEGRKTIAGFIERLAEKGRIEDAEAKSAIDNLEVVDSIDDLAPCNAVVEAIVEKIEIKQKVFEQLEGVLADDAIIASNTSSIPIASIASALKHKDRVAGLHFFNPVPLMKLVEVIRTVETSDEVVDALTALGKRLTRTPVTVIDSPGFLVNMGGRAFSTEGLRIAHEKVATPSQIDAIMRDCHGFRMGPFELLDLTGIDVNYPVSLIVYDGYSQDQRLRTSPNHKAMYDAGRLGRKTGQGFFEYEDGKAVNVPSPDHDFGDAKPAEVALVGDSDALRAFCQDAGIETCDDDGSCPLLAAPFGPDATTTAVDHDLDHRRLVCIDLSGRTEERVTLMTAPGADNAALDAVAASIAASGRAVTAIKDGPGFIGQRMCAMIANLGCYMAEIGLADPEDIDTAMRLGLNYPAGPIELTDRMGAKRVMAILTAAQTITGEDRYRVTQWLRRRALLDLPADTPA